MHRHGSVTCFLAVAACLCFGTSAMTMHVGDAVEGVAAIRSNFASFSMETSSSIPLLTPPAFSTLVRQLDSFTPHPASRVIRIGGNTADGTWWDPSGAPPPNPMIRTNMNQSFIDAWRVVADRANASVVFGTCMLGVAGTANMSWGLDEAAAVAASVGWQSFVESIELGNEPDLFFENNIRPPDYAYSDYVKEFGTYAAAHVAAGLPKGMIQGATYADRMPYVDGLPDYISAYRPYLRTISLHRYSVTSCNGEVPTLAKLLDTSHGSACVDRYRAGIKAVVDAGVEFRLGEANSCSCGGYRNVSNVLGSALWALDFMFGFANVSTSMVNFHGGPNSLYTPVSFNRTSPMPDIRPLFYAMYMFSEATANSSRILHLSATDAADNVPVWAVRDHHGVTRVVIIHKNLDMASTVNVTLAPTNGTTWRGDAEVLTLSAPGGFTAKYGLDYSGVTFDGSTDGKPRGSRTPAHVRPDASGEYHVQVRQATAVMVVLRP